MLELLINLDSVYVLEREVNIQVLYSLVPRIPLGFYFISFRSRAGVAADM